MAFIIWASIGCLLAGIGVRDFFAKKPVGFWANAETMKVNDVRGYNRATGKLFIGYGIVLIFLGLPLLKEQDMPLILLSVFGTVFATITMMVIYSVYITNKYEKK